MKHAPESMRALALNSCLRRAILIGTNWADSTGRRNDVFVDMLEALVKRLGGCFPAQRLAGASIEGGRYGSDGVGLPPAQSLIPTSGGH